MLPKCMKQVHGEIHWPTQSLSWQNFALKCLSFNERKSTCHKWHSATTKFFSHDIVFDLPDGIEAVAQKTSLEIKGADKQLVGQVAAKIRSLKKPEPYKGKGIRYKDEYVRSKQGKTVGGGE